MKSDITDFKDIKTRLTDRGVSSVLVKNNPGFELLTDNGNEDLVNYIEWLKLDKDPNLVVLSSIHHYFYDVEEMKNVKTVVNLIRLNEIKDTKGFLHSIYTILTPKSNLIGYFIDNKVHNGYSLQKETVEDNVAVENGILSKIPLINTIYNMMDSKTNRNISRDIAKLLLSDNGFKVLDMTEINRITYFHAKKI